MDGNPCYHFNNVNGIIFTLRTKGLDNVSYRGAQILGSFGIGYFLDFSFKRRRTRGLVGIGAVAVLETTIWAGGLANRLRYANGKWKDPLDFKDSGGRFGYGLLDATYQSLSYWVIGALADDSETPSRYLNYIVSTS